MSSSNGEGNTDPYNRGHRSFPSLTTNASGFADSTISFGSTGEDPLRLSQFPHPPTDIPRTPLQSDFQIPQPDGHAHVNSPPHTPRRNPSVPRDVGTRRVGHTTPPSPQYASPGPPSQRHPSSPAIPSSLSRVHVPDGSAGEEGRFRSPSSPKSTRTFSAHDWHEGASAIDIYTHDDRYLPTKLITSVLSETESPSYHDSNIAAHSPSAWQKFEPGTPISDSGSGFSELTYPPSRTLHSTAYAKHSSSTTVSSNSQSRYPTTAYIPIELDGNVVSSADSIISYQDHPPVISTASLARRVDSRGVSVVGVASATMRMVSAVSSNPSSRYRGSTTSSTVPLFQSGSRNPDGKCMSGGLGDFHGPPSPMSPFTSPADPNSQFIDKHRPRHSIHSIKSSKTTKSYVSSLLTRLSHSTGARSIRQPFTWFTVRAAPALPGLPQQFAIQEMDYRRMEDSMHLPELVSRAGALSNMLDSGRLPYHSSTSLPLSNHDYNDIKGYPLSPSPVDISSVGSTHHTTADGNVINAWNPTNSGSESTQHNPTTSAKATPTPFFKRRRVIITLIIATVLVIAGIIAGVVVARKEGDSTPVCGVNITGAACTLDAACVCTTTLPGRCDQLAQSLLLLLPTLNSAFDVNYTANSLSTAVWEAQGALVGSNCAPQALLIDVAPGLDAGGSPNRTSWAQSALLWNLVESQDLSAVSQLRHFVKTAPWDKIGSVDGPISDPSSKFSISVSGYIFDFATQTVTQPNVSFTSDGQPSNAQIAEVGDTARTALDRMYSFALASSTQRQNALQNYWQGILQQQPKDLSRFVSAVSASPLLIPFDAVSSPGGHPLSSLLTSSTTSPFPPPLACYPGLSTAQMQRLSTLEESVFGLSAPSSASQFATSCFPDRPIYGVLDVLRLRLPFSDARSGAAKQAAVLSRAVSPRAIVYSGEVVSGLPGASNPPPITASTVDPRQYGTMNHLNHVLLNYLSSIGNVSTATALVEYILNSSAVPPSNTSALFTSMSSLPALEVAIFGTITPADLSGVLSSFSTPSSTLFFGSDQASALRTWAISASQTISWTELSTSPEVVHDSSFDDSTFNSVWTPVATFLHTPNPGVSVTVLNITTAFQLVGKFSP
ncbi:hypothetical protein JAAARDRAFT_53842 [Jaapia argillacea MUCL 33604]|uniref:Uncharacterized protein n=1 Tax=Jaapia argillacea MUCL 33604 TaxID=933084 RepID=A0A067QBV1_9AGAM|nr:hypothetical protein JAAARDRAFT_53842 [Jaapia argillacea MUCL 33604]